jgi:hypothetical protein
VIREFFVNLNTFSCRLVTNVVRLKFVFVEMQSASNYQYLIHRSFFRVIYTSRSRKFQSTHLNIRCCPNDLKGAVQERRVLLRAIYGFPNILFMLVVNESNAGTQLGNSVVLNQIYAFAAFWIREHAM